MHESPRLARRGSIPRDRTVVVSLRGHLDPAASATLAAVLGDLIVGQGNLAVLVDLRNLRGIDNSRVAVLVSAAERIAGQGGALRLGGPSGVVSEVLTVEGLSRLFLVPDPAGASLDARIPVGLPGPATLSPR